MAYHLSRASYWRLRLARWRRPPRSPREGYSILVPVPGDIPVFLELAMRELQRQDADHRVETIVVPDQMTPAMVEIVDRYRPGWSGPLRLQPLLAPERWYPRQLIRGHRYHGLQVVTAVNNAVGSHIVFHDADLFMHDIRLLDGQYEQCRDRELDFLGISPVVWDKWYEEHGRTLAATWEMTASLDCLRSFPPFQIIGFDTELWGELHTFDTTLYAQVMTNASKVDVCDRAKDFVHFNYVTGTYRQFQRHGPGYLDDAFRLVLIALFIEVFGGGEYTRDLLPKLEDLPRGLGVTSAQVSFPDAAAGAKDWSEFRTKLERVLSGPTISTEEADRARRSLNHFDEFYGYSPTSIEV